jgi:predicted Zn-dependent peptidase
MTDAMHGRTAPVLAAPPALRMPRIDRYALSNGLRVLVVEMKGLPIVDVHLLIRTGALADAPRYAGRTSLAVDMLDEGAGTRSAIEIAEAIEDLGASLSASAGWDDIGFGVHAHTSRFGPALDILADVVVRPAITQTDFDRKKQQRLTALLQEKEEPRALASNLFNRVVFGPDHPYSLPMSGTRDSVVALTRNDVAAFHQSYVRPGNAFVVAVGDVDADELVAMLERSLGGWADAPVPPVVLPAAPAVVPAGVYVVDRPASPQSELRVGHAGVARTSPDYFPILVMNTILGGSFTSRLNLNLRQDKGYTYGAGSNFGFRLAAGPFLASTAVDTHVTADAVLQIMTEIRRIRDERVPGDELGRAQSYIALGLPRSFETTADIANHLAEIEIYGLGDSYYDEYVDRVRAVTAEDVQRVARQYLDPAGTVAAVAGDYAAIHDSLKALNLGEVHKRDVEE